MLQNGDSEVMAKSHFCAFEITTAYVNVNIEGSFIMFIAYSFIFY